MSSLVLAMPNISIWVDRGDAIPSDSMMYQHMPAMIAELHRLMAA